MDSSIISGLIGGLFSVVVCTYISKSVRKSEVEGELKYGTFLVALAWFCVLLVVFAFLGFFYDADVWEKKSEFFSILALCFGFGFGAIYCFGEYFSRRYAFECEWCGIRSRKRFYSFAFCKGAIREF